MIVLDGMEYATDAAAYLAYVGSVESNKKLLMHMDASDAAFTDKSQSPHTVSNTNVTYNASGVFGGCAVFNGTSAFLNINDSADWTFGSGDFGIKARVYLDDTMGAAFRIIVAKDGGAASWGASDGIEWLLALDTDGKINFEARVGAGIIITSTNAVDIDGAFHDIEIDNISGTLTMYLDGNSVGSGACGTISTATNNQKLRIGSLYGTGSFWKGKMDEVCIIKGGYFHSGNFTLETSPFSIITVSSEATIKQVGDYSLKFVAPATTSLNATLTHTISPTFNLSGQTSIKFPVRASRTGSNFKIGFHDSGGTTTEYTPNIVSANEFQDVTVDLSSVADADKNAIDRIIVTITNADAENTGYLDRIYTMSDGEGTGGSSLTKVVGVKILKDTGWVKAV